MANHVSHHRWRLMHWSANALGATCVLLIAFGAYHSYCLFRQAFQSIEEQRSQDLSLLAHAAEVRSEKERAVEQLTALQVTLADLKTRIPTAPNEAEFLAQLSALAQRNAVRLRNFRPAQITASGPLSTCDVQLSCVGSFANVCALLQGLTELPRYISVSRLILSGPGKAGDPCNADLTISLTFAPVPSKP